MVVHFFFTEYFRVYTNSGLDKNILSSIIENSTGRPIFAQLIGESIPDLNALPELSHYPVAGIDLNMGCLPKFIAKSGWRVVARSGKDQNNPWRVAGR